MWIELLLLVLVGALGAIIWILIARAGRINDEIAMVQQVMERVGVGESEARVNLESCSDQVALLARQFNELANIKNDEIAQLRHLEKNSRELISNVSHDLRTPLTSLLGYVETLMMKDRQLSVEERSFLLQIVLRNTQSLIRTVGEIFNLAKIYEGIGRPAVEVFALPQLIEDLSFKFHPLAGAKAITLAFDPNVAVDSLEGNYGQIERAISNIIQNAIYYTPSGGRVSVSFDRKKIDANPNSSALAITVTDTGIGIPEQDLPRVFERFYRVNKDRSKETGGTGLGLTIAKEIVEQHQGTIFLRSAFEQGTTVEIVLPLRQAILLRSKAAFDQSATGELKER